MGNQRTQRRIVQGIIGATVVLLLYAASNLNIDITTNLQGFYQPTEPGYHKVANVSDGDTFTVYMDGSKQEVRLVGIDTPETQHPSKPVQCFGPEASAYTESLLSGQQVKLEADAQQGDRDRYGRLLRYAYLKDGRELNQLLVKEGYAFASNFDTEKKLSLKNLQLIAKINKKGLWAQCSVTSERGYLQTNAR